MPTAKRKLARTQAEVVIPEKIYFRIGEVSELSQLPTYVLRFWETEFAQLKPTKSSTGQRMYRRKDVEYVMQIRRLLYEDGFTIAGAREKLREERASRIHGQAEIAAPVEVASPAAESSHASQTGHESQAALPFFAVASGRSSKDRLRKLRQELRAVLDLLS